MRENSSRGASFIKPTMDKKSCLAGKSEIPVYTDEHLNMIFDYAQKNNLATSDMFIQNSGLTAPCNMASARWNIPSLTRC